MSVEPVNADQRPRPRLDLLRFGVPFVALLTIWYAYGRTRLNDFTIGVNSIHDPTFDSLQLALVMSALGIPATYLSCRLFLLFYDKYGPLLERSLRDGERTRALIVLGVLGTLTPLLARYLVLETAPMTDDEASYKFGAELLAQGRLWVRSYKMPLFFDNAFMINNGKMYSQYFLGWPALLSLGVLVGLPNLVNPLLSGITTVLIALIAERRFGATWGRVAGLVYAASPFIAMSAATNMSHTASLFALTLLVFACDRSIEGGASTRLSALVALSACLAFWIRPATGLGFGAPLVLGWLWSLRKHGLAKALTQLGVFLLVAVGPALLFLWANEQQTGSPFMTGYHAGAKHGADTYYRFVSFGPHQVNKDKFFYFFVWVDPYVILSKYVVVLTRLWTDSWGFPIGFALALCATPAGWRRLVGPFIGLLIAHVPLPDAGIDTFGPVHYTELMIPLTLASTDGLRRLFGLGVKIGLRGLSPALLLASALCSALFYGVPHFRTIYRLAQDIRSPIKAFESAPPRSIIFNRHPFAPTCRGRPGSHFVFFRPNNDPRMKNQRLWANHISLELDQQLLASMPGWRGFLLRHNLTECKTELVPIEQASPAEYPPATFLVPGDLGEVPRPM